MQNAIWITWETQRRSLELARILNCKLHIVEYGGFLRYPKSILRTLIIISKSGSSTIFVQNPSMVLATVACLYKIFLKKTVIIDRHTTFRLDKPKSYSLDCLVFSLLNKLTLQVADLTIVTNEYLAGIVRLMHGNPFVLPDKLPDMAPTGKVALSDNINIMLIASYGEDEPIEEVINAVNLVGDRQFTLYVTGNHNKLDSRLKDNSPPNIVFTGFLQDSDFVNLLFSVDAIMVLTTASHCMLCGCYEAVVACKPIITSRKQVLEEYFKGSVFVDNTDRGIAEGLREMITNLDTYKANAVELKHVIAETWAESFSKLQRVLDSFK